MRLYLSSYRLGNRPGEFPALVGGRRRVALILNARDAYPDKRAEDQRALLGGAGLAAEELDLREFAGRATALASVLARFDAVWIPGGNSFLLRRAMYDSGFDGVIGGMLRRDRIVYAGYSAAVVVLAPSLRGVEVVDDPGAVQATYGVEPVWEGLGILPYAVVPHYESDHPEAAAVGQEVAYLQREGIAYRTLKDGEAIVIDGAREDVVR